MNALDRLEENYERKLRYHRQLSLDVVFSHDGNEFSLKDTIEDYSCSGEDYLIKQTEKLLYEEAKRELDVEHRLIFEAVFEKGMKFNSACQLTGKSDKTAKKYYLEACKYILKKIQA